MFTEGQKVWDAMFGPGVVSEILTGGSSFPVRVRFDNDLRVKSFTLDGKLDQYDDKPSLSVIE